MPNYSVTTPSQRAYFNIVLKFGREIKRLVKQFHSLLRPTRGGEKTQTAYSLYSFDIFDTLITRKTATPRGIFCIVQDVLRRNHSENYPVDLIEDFFFYRTEAEQTARQKNGGGEITFDQIYEALFETFQDEVTRGDIWKIRDIEIETELQWCVPIPENISKVHSLLDSGKKVVLISDMYLPSSIIQKMLEACDERLAHCPIYVSCEAGTSKHSGGLFKHVLSETKTQPGHWHHTGDNRKADYKAPRSMGIQAALYSRTALNEIENSCLEENDLFHQLYIGTSRLYRIHHSDADDKQIIGASLVGPLLFPYVDFLLHDAKQRGIKRLYFLARDGQILLKIAKIINEEQNLNLELRYLYCARQVLYQAALFHINTKTLELILRRDIWHSLEMISKRFGLSPEEMLSSLPKDIAHRIKHISLPYGKADASKIKDFILSDEKIKQQIVSASKQHREILVSYLQQEGFWDQQVLGIVDMGWHGNMQDALTKIIMSTQQRLTIHGYYFTLLTITGKTSERNCKHTPLPSVGMGIPNVNPLELITSADHGTTSGYFKDETGRIVPKLGQGEHLRQWGIPELQDAALWFCSNYQNTAKLFGNFGISPLSMLEPLLASLNHPSKWVADTLGTIPFSTEQNDMSIKEAAPVFSLWQAIEYRMFRWFCSRTKLEYTCWESATLARSPKLVKAVLRIGKKSARKVRKRKRDKK